MDEKGTTLLEGLLLMVLFLVVIPYILATIQQWWRRIFGDHTKIFQGRHEWQREKEYYIECPFCGESNELGNWKDATKRITKPKRKCPNCGEEVYVDFDSLYD